MVVVRLEEAKANLTALVNDVLQGKKVIIQKNAVQMIQMLPLQIKRPKPQFGNAAGLIEMSDDFDEPLEDFKDYMV